MSEPIWFSALIRLLEGYPVILACITGGMLGLMLIMRGLSEILLLFVEKTKTEVDDDFLIGMKKIMVFLSTILAWFGVGYPDKLK